MKSLTRLWVALFLVTFGSLGILSYYGLEIYRSAPPIPETIVNESGQTIFTGQDIKDGQNVWQSMGGHTVGTIWGHGAYVAPDWSADWLHREAVFILEEWAQKDFSQGYDSLGSEQQA
ncbi:MAG: nitric-oxide reductase large subunit, partial [Bdellovibrionales bacterium]|nr:nitric-oxide reductase large subunit [Bdellovibrionales bacterium]